MQKEQEFFKQVAPKLLELIPIGFDGAQITNNKGVGDFATDYDLKAEELIVGLIKDLFPDDEVLAEEGFSDTSIGDGRIWIIDPICGTTNLSRGVPTYCANIALAENQELIASCVVDFANRTFYWSTGDGVYKEDKMSEPFPKESKASTVIDVDMGAATKLEEDILNRYANLLKELLPRPGLVALSLNTSLSFLFVAIGKFDGLINIHNNPWDVAASAFLVMQNGGKVTNLDGTEWKLNSNKGMVISLDHEIHQDLVDTFNS